jgi:hypothetical protein
VLFCEKKQSSKSNPLSKLQEKLEADLKKQQVACTDEKTCNETDKIAWVTKKTDFAKVGMTSTKTEMKFDDKK